MLDGPLVEYIDPDLEELMERFFANSKSDLEKMQETLDSGDYPTLVRLGHTAKGTGYGYGFRGMGDLGKKLEQAAKDEDARQAQALIEDMGYYLDNVQVKFGSVSN